MELSRNLRASVVGLAAPWIVLLVGIAVSVGAWKWTKSQVEARARGAFEEATLDIRNTIQSRLTSYIDVLYGLQGLFHASPEVSRASFHRYATSLGLPHRHPQVRSVTFSPVVTPASKTEFEQLVRDDASIDPGGNPDFAIRPPGNRPLYVPLTYIEPMQQNRSAFGFDLASEPGRLLVMERARDTGRVVASEKIVLQSDPGQGTGVVLRLAVYRPGAALDAVEDRRRAFSGIVGVTVRIRDVVEDVLANTLSGDIGLRMVDLGGPASTAVAGAKALEDLLWSSPARSGAGPLFEGVRSLDFGGRQWDLAFTAPEARFAASGDVLPKFTLAAGLLMSFLLAGFIYSLSSTSRRAVRIAEVITRDLRNSEARLAETQRRTQELIEALPNPIFFKDTDGRYLGVNKAWESFFGISRASFVGKTVRELYPHDSETAERLHAMDQVLWRNPGKQTYETTISLADATVREAIYYKATYTGADGRVAGLIGTIIDVTERKRLERRYRDIFDQAAVGIMQIDLDGNCTDVNQRFCDMLALRREELLGRPESDITHEADRAEDDLHRAALRSGGTSSIATEKRFLRADGEPLWARRTLSAAKDDAGRSLYLISVVEDISERKRTEDALRRSEATLRAVNQQMQMVIGSSPLAIYTRDRDGLLRSWNPAAEKMFGWSAAEVLGKPLLSVSPQDLAESDAFRARLLAGEPPFKAEVRRRRRNGSFIEIDAFLAQLRDAEGNITGIMTIAADITERKQAERLQAMEVAVTRVIAESSTLMEAIPRVLQSFCESLDWQCGACWELDSATNLLHCLGTWSAEERELRDFAAAVKRRSTALEPIDQGLLRRTYGTREPVWIEDVTREAGFRRQSLAAAAGLKTAFAFPLMSANEVIGAMEFFSRSTLPRDPMLIRSVQTIGSQMGQYLERMRAEEALKFVATHDGLTNLPNRVLFIERLGHAIAQAQRHSRRLSVLFVDLDRFKVINDTLGHDIGDELLREMAARMIANVRETDTVARLGGDEFVVLLEEIGSPAMVRRIARKLLASLGKGAFIANRELGVTASIGVSTFPEDGADAHTLLKNADIAMYRAKDLGRNTFQFYSAALNVHTIEHLTLETNLRRALERDELLLHFQPVMDVASGGLTGFEALVRWQHPERGLVPPGDFIAIAEETGLIVPIGEWVLTRACATQSGWKESGLPDVRMSVNLSARQIMKGDLLKDVARVLRLTRCSATSLDLEITESMVMHNPDHAVAFLAQLKEMGVQVTMDDFGTGYSSLAYLQRLPIDRLKIDRSFVAEIPRQAGSMAITRAVIAMAHSLSLAVIAEGVETREQLDFLSAHGCHEMQGFYFSRPVAEGQARVLLRKARSRAGRRA